MFHGVCAQWCELTSALCFNLLSLVKLPQGCSRRTRQYCALQYHQQRQPAYPRVIAGHASEQCDNSVHRRYLAPSMHRAASRDNCAKQAQTLAFIPSFNVQARTTVG